MSFMDYYRKHGPRAYPSDYKRCMQCGEVVRWENDCTSGHFAQIGKDIKRKAAEVWGPRRKA